MSGSVTDYKELVDPSLSKMDEAHERLTDSEFGGNVRESGGSLHVANSLRFLPIKFGTGSPSDVLLGRNGFKVVGIDAPLVPAQVIELQTFRDIPAKPYIDPAMRSFLNRKVGRRSTVARAIYPTIPFPTPSLGINGVHRLDYHLRRLHSVVVAPDEHSRLALLRLLAGALLPSESSPLATAALAESNGNDRLGAHFDLLSRVPQPGVFAHRPAFRCPNYNSGVAA